MRKLAAVAIAGSLQEAGDRRFAFMRPPPLWKNSLAGLRLANLFAP